MHAYVCVCVKYVPNEVMDMNMASKVHTCACRHACMRVCMHTYVCVCVCVCLGFDVRAL
jgi:hypothetical protein